MPARPSHRKPVSRRVRDRLAYSLDTRFNTERTLLRSIQLDIATASRLAAAPPARKSQHLLLAPKGRGNIGDQAMLEAFLDSTTFPVTLLVEANDSHVIPERARDRVTEFVVQDLFSTRPWVRHRNRRKVAQLIARHTTFSIVGADIMDGSVLDGGSSDKGFETAESTIRFGMLCMSNELDTDNRVLGFSWKDGRAPETVRRALSASQPQSRLCVRDPHSLARLRSEGTGYNLVQVADMAFTVTGIEAYEPLDSWVAEQNGRRIVLVNASGVLARKGIDPDEYVTIVDYLTQRGCSVVILPHTIRPGDNDVDACRQVVSRLHRGPHVYLVEDLLNPHQVSWLAGRASAVFTGRMHLAILSLNQGVPTAILSTQGKVSGLLELLDLSELLLEPVIGFARNAIKAIDTILDDPTMCDRLATNLPKIRELAELNFEGLEQS